MVTAVQPMFGLLKRLHLHPMESALNELTPQTSLIESIKFRAHPFWFRKTKSEEIHRDHNYAGQKRQSAYLSNAHLTATKRSRRAARLSDKNANLIDINVKNDCYENPSVLRYSTVNSGVSSSNLQLFSSPKSISPPNFPTSAAAAAGVVVAHTRRGLLSPEPLVVLPHSKSSISSPQASSQSTGQYRSQITPVARANPVENQTCLILGKNDLVPDENRLVDTKEESITTTTTPCYAKDTPYLSKVTNYPPGQNPQDVRIPPRPRTTTTTRKASPASLLCKRCDNCDNEKLSVRLKNKEKTVGEFKEPPKRRKSVDQLKEPSIHGLPDPEISTKPRSRRPTQFLQLNVPTTETSCNEQKSTYLTSQSYYYTPDFTVRRSRGSESAHIPEKTESKETQRVQKPDDFIEVPSWRIIPIPVIENAIDCSCETRQHSLKSTPRKPQSTNKLTDSDNLKSHNLRPQRPNQLTGATTTTSTNRSGSSSQTQKSRSQTAEHGKSIDALDEDISDAAYLARHSRLEVEEARRERLSRQRTAEQELKQRLEEREQASWHKRQSGRLDPLLKFNPASRMPTQLSYTFKQGHQFHLDNSIPVVVFGCRVPSASLKPFTKSSIP
ncbi:unnamed protein product [Trichobilharzia szidati]|nr:unnamed protein product [Trichobilharzia szidati]